jgi:phage N-6-adenine-methyltransferase
MTVSQVLLSKGKNLCWQTPLDLFNQLDNEFHFILDACTSQDNPLDTPYFYTEKENGLCHTWAPGPVFVNPPYGRKFIVPWLQKAVFEQIYNEVTSVFLLPARTGTNWFHTFIYNKENIEIRFLKGRLKFQGTHNSAPFDSMIVIYWGAER